MALLSPLDDDQRATFLVVALPQPVLRKLAGKLGVAPRGTRLDALSVWELADALVDYYQEDAEVSAEVDRALRKTLGDSPLAAAVSDPSAGPALADFALRSPDPLRDLAWALLAHGPAETGPLASDLVATIIAEYDAADERARADAAEPPGDTPAAAPEPDAELRSIAKEAARARTARARALKRAQSLKDQLVDLEERLAAARAEQRREHEARTAAEVALEQARGELATLRAQLAGGAAGELARLERALAEAERRNRALDAEAEQARDAETTLATRLRAIEQERAATTPSDGPAADRADGPPATWSLPVFTDEFYESIRRWDRKVVRNAFEKVHRLAEDWRHPSLRAIPLEGLPGHYRIRIASDVRLIYRLLDGGRLEIRSLIDREDLQRYIRTAKTRQSG